MSRTYTVLQSAGQVRRAGAVLATGWNVRPPAEAVVVNFKRTDRNRAADGLEKLGFATNADGPLRRNFAPGDLAVDFMA